MMSSRSHLVLIPSYNTGQALRKTVADALAHWRPVWVVNDGSTDGSVEALLELQSAGESLRVLNCPRNGGKGEAVLCGMISAAEAGFSHALVMDADGQHPAEQIGRFMEESLKNPDSMILGVPQFDADAPTSRRHGRRIGNWWANLETLWGGVQDSLFGLRVYPIGRTVRLLRSIRSGRRYDFDTVVAVRLFWEGVRPINLPVPVRYFTAKQGGVSHFRYCRDNLLLVFRHTCMVCEMPFHLRRIWRSRQIARSSWKAGLDESAA